MCILEELYHEWHSPREKSWSEIRDEWDRSEDLWAQAEKCLDAELFEELQLSMIHLMDLENCREFQEGFRLGAQLMLELQSPAGPPQSLPPQHNPAPRRWYASGQEAAPQ